MRLKRSFKLAATTAIAAAAATSCNTTGCFENRSSLPLARFMDSATNSEATVDSIAIGGVGAPGDSLLNTPGAKSSTVYLPLRSKFDSTSFFFNYLRKNLAAKGVSDTITIDYTTSTRFISEECGALYVYRITALRHTDNEIDSVAVLDSLVTNTDIPRIEIFFKPSVINGNDGNTPQE